MVRLLLSGRSSTAVAVLLGLLLCAVTTWLLGDVFVAPLTAEIGHAANDDWDWQLASWEASRRQVVDGVVPTWAPWVSGGVPLLGNPENPGLFPGFLLVLFLGTVPAMKLLLVAQWWLLIWGGWWAGREFGLSPVSAHFGSMALIFSAFLPEFVGWGHQMFLALGWLPIAVVLLRRGRWALGGAAIALPLLYGAHYLFFFGVLWATVDALCRAADERRLRWLVPGLALNAVLLTLPAGELNQLLFWPIAALLIVGGLQQRPGRGLSEPQDTLLPLLAAGVVAGALIAPKVLASGDLVGASERLTRRLANASLAESYHLAFAWDVLRGAVARPGGHEGQNVFFSAFPVAAGFLGILAAAWQRPRWGLTALFFWSLGWADATPVNLLEVINQLPGFDLLGKVERYALLWSLFLGYGVGHLADRLWSRFGLVTLVVFAIGTGLWVRAALPHVHQHILTVDPAPAPDPRTFAQTTGGDVPALECVRADVGRVDLHLAAPVDQPPEGLRVEGDPGYRGEAFYADDGTPVPVEVRGSISDVFPTRPGRVVLNQAWFPGWRLGSADTQPWEGLVSAELVAGEHRFRYWPAGLTVSLLLCALGWIGVGVAAIRALRDR